MQTPKQIFASFNNNNNNNNNTIHPSPKMKMKVNFYLDCPQHSYYEVLINPHKDTPTSIIESIIQKLYPPHLHSYSTLDPAFVHVQTGSVLDPHKPFAENGINHSNHSNHSNHGNHSSNTEDVDVIPDVRIRLKINVLPLSLLPAIS